MNKFVLGGLIVVLVGGGGVAGWYFLNGDGEPVPENSTITLGTFNVQNLGKASDFQVANVASIIGQFDLVAIQEVMNYGGGIKGPAAIQALVDALGDDWDSVISTAANGTESAAANSSNPPSFEFYAFVWRKSRIDLVDGSAHLWDEDAIPDQILTDESKPQERQFDREPFIASFTAIGGTFDFTIISFHAASPGKSWRDDEIRRLATVYETVQASDPNQNDVFLLGDFNTPVDKAEWDDVKAISTMTHILSPDDKTTLNRNTGGLSQNQYDTVWYQASASAEDVIRNSGQVLDAWNATLTLDPEADPPDTITGEEDRERWHYARVVSDHLPVILVVRTDQDTDRFE